MRDEYNFSKGVRGKHDGIKIRIVGAKAAGSQPVKVETSKAKTTQAPKDRDDFDEAVKSKHTTLGHTKKTSHEMTRTDTKQKLRSLDVSLRVVSCVFVAQAFPSVPVSPVSI